MRWWWLFLCCSLPSLVVATPDEASKMTIWHIRMLTVVNDRANKTIVSQGVAKLAENFDVYYVDFVPKTPANHCQELKQAVDKLNTSVVLTLEETNQCQLADESFPKPNEVFVQVVSSEPNDTTADIEQGWNTFAAEVNRTAHPANSFVSLKSANLQLDAAKEKTSGLIFLPIWLAVALVILILALVLVIALLLMKLKKSQMTAKKPSQDQSQKSKKSTESSHSTTLRVVSETSGKSKKTSAKKPSSKSSSKKSDKTEKSSKDGKRSPETDKKSTKQETNSQKSSKDDKKVDTSPPIDLSGFESTESVAMKRPDRSRETVECSPPPPSKRSKERILQEPINSIEFKYYVNKVSRMLVEYYDDPTVYKVTPNEKPGFLFKQLPKTAPNEPEDFNLVFTELRTSVMNGMTHWQHPRFYAYYPSGRNYACMLADLIISGLGVDGFSWDSCPALTEMEQGMVNWIGRALGIPESFLFQGDAETSVGGGCMFETASDACHCAVLASRQWKISQVAEKALSKESMRTGITYDMVTMHDIGKKLVAYTSKESHSSIEKACKLAMVQCRPIQASKENDWGLVGSDIEKEIEKDLARGLIPTHIHLTLGTTSNASSDHLESIWPVAEKHNMWIHIDAAYAGCCWIDPKNRTNCAGLEHVNSIAINPHKMLQHTTGCCIFWTKDQRVYKNAFAITPVYLKPIHKNASDLRDWTVQLSRRFMALKTWVVFRIYGIHGMQNYINNAIDMAAYFESLVAAHPNFRIFAKRHFGCFCFQYHEPGMSEAEINSATQKFCQFLNATHQIFLTHTMIGNNNLIRISINYERTTKATVDESWCIIQDLLEEFRPRVADPGVVSSAGTPLPGRSRALLPGDMDYGVVGNPNLKTDDTANSAFTHSPNVSRHNSFSEASSLAPTQSIQSRLAGFVKGLELPYPFNMDIPVEPVTPVATHSGTNPQMAPTQPPTPTNTAVPAVNNKDNKDTPAKTPKQ